MYPPRYIQYLDLPLIPDDILASLDLDPAQHLNNPNNKHYGTYIWSDYHTEKLNQWCKANISQDLYYGMQLMTGDVPIHEDIGTKIKINYLIDTGGKDVKTSFYDENTKNLLDCYVIEPRRWHIFRADTPHGITNIQHTRISITARIF